MRGENMRTGIRIKGKRGNPDVRRAFIGFDRWLRSQYKFPIRGPVYLFPRDHITTMHGDKVSASFFAPWDRNIEPYIRVATGDFQKLKREHGHDNALASFLHSFAHELVHYQQWVETGEITERGVVRRARRIIDTYATTVDHP